jgi:hypothetical protein
MTTNLLVPLAAFDSVMNSNGTVRQPLQIFTLYSMLLNAMAGTSLSRVSLGRGYGTLMSLDFQMPG